MSLIFYQHMHKWYKRKKKLLAHAPLKNERQENDRVRKQTLALAYLGDVCVCIYIPCIAPI